MCRATLSNDAEVIVTDAFRLPFTFDLGYFGGGGAVVEPCEKFFEWLLGTLGQTFDAAIITIAHPSRETE